MKLTFISILIIVLIVAFFNIINKEDQYTDPVNTPSAFDLEKVPTMDNPTNVQKKGVDNAGLSAENQEVIDFQVEPVKYLNICGLENTYYWENSLKQSDIDINDLTENQLNAFDQLSSKELCNDWYEYADTLSEEDLIEIKNLRAETGKLYENFSSFSDKDKIEHVRKILNGDLIGLDKSFALYYLLENDFEFTKLVANEINTENLRYVSQSAFVVADLFICQSNPSSCSKKSSKMLQICLFEEEYCNIDYIGYLEKKHTLNEVNDFYNILDAARKLLDI